MAEQSVAGWWSDSYLGMSSEYLDELYEQYLADPQAVPEAWQHYFAEFSEVAPAVSHAQIRQAYRERNWQAVGRAAPQAASAMADDDRSARVQAFVEAYRTWGHLHAQLDPLQHPRPQEPRLALATYGLSVQDDRPVKHPLLPQGQGSLVQLEALLAHCYSGVIGIEYQHVRTAAEQQWLREKMEKAYPAFQCSTAEQTQLLKHLIAAEGMETFLGTKYVGQKRFSLQGGDSLIPCLHAMIQSLGGQGVQEVVIGMAHRGRLNVMLNVLGMSAQAICQAFEGQGAKKMTTGDVKYHMGYSSDIQTPNGAMHLSLGFNPSHLEAISPVVMGSVKSRQIRAQDASGQRVVPILIHGDSAFTGQGVVMETLNMSKVRAYDVGGSIHVVVNNQIGFTTSRSDDVRTAHYCTNVVKMIDAPVLHVNADHPEAVLFAARLAAEYRQTFAKDIVIDLVCYRRLGHNEADEPAATQPLMYAKIRQHPSTPERYGQYLVATGVLTEAEVQQHVADYQAALTAGKHVVAVLPEGQAQKNTSAWQPYIDQAWKAAHNSGFAVDRLQALARQMVALPEGFECQRQVGRLLAARQRMADGEQALDWGQAELLAYASLMSEGYPVRLLGQDVCRGTFGHRHAVLHDMQTGTAYCPLNHLEGVQVRADLFDSVLSEEAALGFEYGYATSDPNSLVIWEAQFGDFANGAQVMIDQFISSGWQKWQRLCGLVMLLPHGYEGMGPEHSSARLERFLQLTAQLNLQVCVPSTPAQIFHLLRRQMVRPYRKPLVVMTPKSLLRHPQATSSLAQLAEGGFELVIDDASIKQPETVKRVVLCAGKVYYDLLALRDEREDNHVALVRIEQLYPFPNAALTEVLARYTQAATVVWCQEEPRNQGAWYSKRHCFQRCLAAHQELSYAGRRPSAAPACGYLQRHLAEQKQLVADALGLSVDVVQ